MLEVYFGAIFITFVISHYGINSKYRSAALEKFSLLIIFAILLIVSGLRSDSSIGDTFFYSHTYRLLGENPVIPSNSRDTGFTMLNILLNRISEDPQLLIFVTAFITNIFVVTALYKYCKPFELGIFLYFGTVQFYVTMNGIRQAMVAAILFWAVRYIIDRKWIKYFVLVLLLSTIHQSALIFIPIYFLVQREAWGKCFWITLGSAFMLAVIFRPMLQTFVSILDSTSYSNYSQDMLNNSETVNMIRVIIMLIPLILAYIIREKLKKEWPESSIFIYMSLLNFIFMFLGTQYLYFYRLCIYFDLFNLVLIPRIIFFYRKQRRLTLYIFILVFYCIFCWYQINQWHDYYVNILIPL